MQKTRNRHLQVAVIGKGRLGASFAMALRATKHFTLHAHLPARAASFRQLENNGGPDIVFIITRDQQVASVAAKVIKHCGDNLQLVAHCAGSIGPDILPRSKHFARATFHPIQTFATPNRILFNSITFTISTTSKKAASLLSNLARELGASKTLQLDPKLLPLYHSLIVYGSNFIKLLGTAIEAITAELGMQEKAIKSALRPILTRALEDILSKNSRHVLTGPIARGDKATIERHRKALKTLPPEILGLYDDFVLLAKRYGLWNMK